MRRPALVAALVLAAAWILAAIAWPGFRSGYQAAALLADNASLGLAALGAGFVILAGGIDLSVGAVSALGGLVCAQALTAWGLPAPLALALPLAVGAGIGAGQGLAIRALRLPPFLVTLAGLFLARAAALALTDAKRVSLAGAPLAHGFGRLALLGVDAPGWILLGATAMAVLAARHVGLLRVARAMGSSARAAELMALPVARAEVLVYALSGLAAAAGGVVAALATEAGDANAGTLMELDAIAAVVIGGTALSGGRGGPAGTLPGVLLLGLVATLPSYVAGLDAWWTRIAVGALLLAFVGLQRALGGRAGDGD